MTFDFMILFITNFIFDDDDQQNKIRGEITQDEGYL